MAGVLRPLAWHPAPLDPPALLTSPGPAVSLARTHAPAHCPAESAVGQLERIRRTLEDLLLLPPEVEEAALKCCWLAHYWVRSAARLPGCPAA